MSNKTQVRVGGNFFVTGLTLIFVTLKLTGYIAWSWWYVLAPLWVPYAIVGLILLVALVASVISLWIRDYKNKTRV